MASHWSSGGDFDWGGAAWRRPSAQPRTGRRRGLGDGGGLASMLAFCADRPAAMGTALRERVKVDLRCKVKMSYGRIRGRVVDLSRSGAFVTCSHSMKGLRPGAPLRLALARGWLGLATSWLDAVVVWQGEKQGKAGFAVRFQFQHNDGLDILGRYLKRAG